MTEHLTGVLFTCDVGTHTFEPVQVSCVTSPAWAVGTADCGMHVPAELPLDCLQQRVSPLPVESAAVPVVPVAEPLPVLALLELEVDEPAPPSLSEDVVLDDSEVVPASAVLPALYVDVVGLAKVHAESHAAPATPANIRRAFFMRTGSAAVMPPS